jgi:hypothetical protein
MSILDNGEDVGENFILVTANQFLETGVVTLNIEINQLLIANFVAFH